MLRYCEIKFVHIQKIRDEENTEISCVSIATNFIDDLGLSFFTVDLKFILKSEEHTKQLYRFIRDYIKGYRYKRKTKDILKLFLKL